MYSAGTYLHDYALSVEHVFELVIEGITGMKLLENMIWGEADCFVQYHFPTQTSSVNPEGSSGMIVHGKINVNQILVLNVSWHMSSVVVRPLSDLHCRNTISEDVPYCDDTLYS